ncbi:MAG: molybdopterin-dependent oxidoreductase [Proteobacteria bacterium]|nr:molybdopterin-dependent oxidoreductase [Pseudomonadota bacterium]
MAETVKVGAISEYVGQSMPRYEGLGQVTGTTTYVDDIQLPGMVYVKVLRSPVHKGVIRHLDLSGAEKTPGVVGVLTAKDIPGANTYGKYNDQPVFTPDHIRYKGERIAGVVAVDEETAVEALEKVKLDIEEQTPVFDMFEAIKPKAPLVRPGSKHNLWVYEPGNMTTRVLRLGDVEKGFAEADQIIEGRYTNGVQDHAAMEPHVSVAYVDEAERLAIHTVSQCLYFQLGMLSAIFKLPMSKIRYIGGTVGGGFGGKNDIHCDHIAGLAALKFRKPVKYRLTRREDLRYSTKRGPWVFEYRDGVKKDGRIIARQIREWHDTGAYGGMSAYATEKCGMFASGPYAIPNILVEAQTIFTNKCISSSMRGFSVINGQSAVEIQMNRIAEAIGMDPWELRFTNAWRDGDKGVTEYEVRGAGALEAMKKAAELAGIQLPKHLKDMSSRRR